MTYEQQYLNILHNILEDGWKKKTRNGSTKSLFGKSISHKMSDGFPILTTRKINFKNAVVELLWFLKGNTSIKFLLENNCHIWTGDCYSKYLKFTRNLEEPDYRYLVDSPEDNKMRPFTVKEFENQIINDSAFSSQFGDVGKLYPYQWRTFDTIDGATIDQIQYVIDELKTSPDSRRICVDSWDVENLGNMIIYPCHPFFQFFSRELTFTERYSYFCNLMNKGGISFNIEENHQGLSEEEITKELDWANVPKRNVSLQFTMRSSDVPLGLPTNMMVYALLLEMVAKEVNMIPDELLYNGGDVHIYENQIEGVKEQLSRTPLVLPTLKMKNRKSINDYRVEDFELVDYNHHNPIKYPLSN